MERLGTLLYENAEGYKLFGLLARDASAQRVSAQLYGVRPDGEMSDLMKIGRKDACTKKNLGDFLLDLEADFTTDEVLTISSKIRDLLNNDNFVELQNKQTMSQMYDCIIETITEISGEPEHPLHSEIFIENDFGYIHTTIFDAFCQQCQQLDFKRVEVLQRLKVMGALKVGKGRVYDMTKKVNGKPEKFYCIEMEDRK